MLDHFIRNKISKLHFCFVKFVSTVSRLYAFENEFPLPSLALAGTEMYFMSATCWTVNTGQWTCTDQSTLPNVNIDFELFFIDFKSNFDRSQDLNSEKRNPYQKINIILINLYCFCLQTGLKNEHASILNTIIIINISLMIFPPNAECHHESAVPSPESQTRV